MNNLISGSPQKLLAKWRETIICGMGRAIALPVILINFVFRSFTQLTSASHPQVSRIY
ncbi:hypothetical protein GNE08_00775 [Trichormus variabilis ARAD]|uniref:Uncharacterized protein n=1 Tax=Trichormus variabilis N2B TaxID=2681315 RepID=A0ABR6SCL7_ANAVA|nr:MULTISPECIES: hypothetical protein [Nostocaceae]MBC1212752.1 hypothetical protein [Trichormus variabilis ARAD]MBC1256384.1 hypothetical protein [Trichormus variabilis V5]MBC1269523.1 hypothetical protein [Trichormus variabilis FSR]MBC1304152.1 hypothetical protein [Trichormus variabilis N2B]MBC1313082.1 hypothetical protein [Trichormus variabilis PNB]